MTTYDKRELEAIINRMKMLHKHLYQHKSTYKDIVWAIKLGASIDALEELIKEEENNDNQ